MGSRVWGRRAGQKCERTLFPLGFSFYRLQCLKDRMDPHATGMRRVEYPSSGKRDCPSSLSHAESTIDCKQPQIHRAQPGRVPVGFSPFLHRSRMNDD